MQPIVFPHKALDPVSGDRVADLAAGGDADPARGFGTRCPKDEKTGGADLTTPFREPEKIGPPEQTLVFGKGEQRELPRSIGPPPGIGRQTEVTCWRWSPTNACAPWRGDA